MAKIESIRPGDTIEASFERYPLADLLAGILRGNLSGRMVVFLHPEPRNLILFRDGVPCWLELPDARVSLVSLLVKRRLVPQERGLDLLRVAEASGRSEADLIAQAGLLSASQLNRVKAEQARAQLVRLFDVGGVDFSFTEGIMSPPSAPIILQPLPLIYEGLCSVTGRLEGFAQAEAGALYSLTGTYPRGVDPFEWGPEVEALVSAPAWSLAELQAGGLSPEQAAAVLYVLKKVDMAEPADAAARRTLRPKQEPSAPPEPVQPEPQRPPTAEGLIVHRRGPGAAETEAEAPKEDHAEALGQIRERLGPYADQSYYQVLRVSPSTDAAQLDRSYRYQLRRLNEEGGAAALALAGLVEEAYRGVTDPTRSEVYAELVIRDDPQADAERQALEAEAKVERALLLLAEDKSAEATYLFEWATRLDPSRSELVPMAQLADLVGSSPAQREAGLRDLKLRLKLELGRNKNDAWLRLGLAWVFLQLKDGASARSYLQDAPLHHPLTRWLQRAVGRLRVSR